MQTDRPDTIVPGVVRARSPPPTHRVLVDRAPVRQTLYYRTAVTIFGKPTRRRAPAANSYFYFSQTLRCAAAFSFAFRDRSSAPRNGRVVYRIAVGK